MGIKQFVMQQNTSCFECEAPFYAHHLLRAISKADIGFIKLKNGYKIRCGLWMQAGDVSKGTVFLQQGRGECLEKYHELIGEFYKRGYNVAGFDWLGQGLSDRLSINAFIGHINSFDTYINTYEYLLDGLYLNNCPKPWVGLGHSMGGCISLSVALKRNRVFDKLILTAPMLCLSQSKWLFKSLLFVKPVFSYFNWLEQPLPNYGVQGLPTSRQFDFSKLSSCASRFKSYQDILNKCPSLALGAPSFQWLFSALDQMQTIRDSKQLAKLELPVLLLSPQDDSIVNAQKNESVVSQLKHHTIVKLFGAKHELHMETDEFLSQFWQHVVSFIEN